MQPLTRLWHYATRWHGKIILATIYSALNKLFDIAPEILIGVAVDVVVNQDQSFVARLGFPTPHEQIAVLAIATFLIWASESIFEYLYAITWRGLAQSMQHALRMDTYRHVQALDMEWFEDQGAGNLLSIMGEDVNQLERFLDTGANEIIQIAVSTLLIGGVFLYLDPTIAFLSLLPIPVILVCIRIFKKRLAERYASVRNAAGMISDTLGNHLSGMATIRSFTRETQEADRLESLSQDYQTANEAAIRLSSAFIPIIRMAILAGFLVTLVIGGFKTFAGDMDVSAYSVLIFLTQRLLWPFTKLGITVDLFARAMASTKRILDLLETPFNIREPEHPKALQKVHGAIRFENMDFHYANGFQVFDRLNLDIEPGSMVALVGPTGSGKTSLVKLVLRFLDPSHGRVLLDGIDLRDLSIRTLRSQIALVSQDIFMFHGTVQDNIAFGRDHADHEAVIAAARASEAHDFIMQLPDGYDTIVGERGQRLSGGQRQRLSIARAILKNAPILIFDEATSAVDNETEAAIQKSLAHLAKGRTTLVIAHRLSTIRHADRILVLDRGQIVESGTHDELVDSGNLYASLWRIQTGQA